MKTTTTLLYILAGLLSVFSVQTANAQAVQDALYIFRNDGQFNAFFFGDIDRIEYSKIDTLGVEQADYVVQEVYAMDSVFRIPISAIDSVAFVTPETKYKEGVIKIEESLRNYVTAVDSLTLTLVANTPDNIVPKVGDKLTMLEVNDIFPYGFAGVVAKVENNGNGYTVTCESAALTDLFDHLVIKGGAECVMDDQANSRKKNRAIIDKDYVKKIDLPTITNNLILTESLGVGPFSADASATITSSIQMQMWDRFYIYVDLLYGTYYSHQARTQFTKDFALNLAGSLTAHINAPIVPILVPLGQPFVRLDITAGLFFEGQGSLNTAFKITDVSRLMSELRYTNSFFTGAKFSYGDNIIPETIKHEESWQKLSGKVSLTTGIYCDLAFVALVKDLASISYTEDRGTRLDIESDVRPEDFKILADWDAVASDKAKVYNFLDREGTITKSFVSGSQVTVKGGMTSTSGRREHLVSSPEKASFVPHFSNARVEPDPNGNNSMAKYSVDISGKTFVPHKLGYICYEDDEDVVDKDFLDVSYENGQPNTMTMWIKNLKPGQKYIVYPLTDIDNPFGYQHYELIGNPALEFTGFRSVADLVVFDKNVDYYNSEYCLGFSDYNDGHYFHLYKQKEKGSTTPDRCLAGYYTADNSKMEITLTEVASVSGGQDNPFWTQGLRRGDVIIATYSQADGAFVLKIGEISLSLKEGIELKGTWKTLDGLAAFDFTFGRYRCNGNLYLTTGPIVNQYEQTIKFRIHWVYDTTTNKAESCKITLPTGEEITVECKDYIVPYTVETKDGVKYLSFELFGYPFVLTKTAD